MECTSEKTTKPAEDVEEACVAEQPTTTPIPNGDWQQRAPDPTDDSHQPGLTQVQSGIQASPVVAVNGVNHQPSSPPVEHGPSPVNNTPTREVDQGEKHTTKTKEPVRLEDDWDIGLY